MVLLKGAIGLYTRLPVGDPFKGSIRVKHGA